MTSVMAVDLYGQALKCLAERCPFDTEEFLSRVPTLPLRFASHFTKNSDGHRKFKKHSSHAEAAPSALPQASKQSSMWDKMEEYFRPITEEDIKFLEAGGVLGSCFSILKPENSSRKVKKDVSFSENGVIVSSKLAKQEEEEGLKSGKAQLAVRELEGANEMKDGDKSEKPKAVVRELEEAMHSFGNHGSSTRTFGNHQEEDNDEASSINWLLGSKHRVILTTERPTKKRKLLGSDAGLNQLVSLPHAQESASAFCDVCCLGVNGVKSNGFISCSYCSVLVHKKCYGVCGAVEDPWLCSWCKHLEGTRKEKEVEESALRPCELCPKDGGALKLVGGDYKSHGGNKFVHLFCGLWTPEVYVEDTGAMEPVMNVGGVPEMRTRLVCNVCKVKHGACVRCSHGTCRTAFHPICAREARHQMEIWGKFGCDNVELRSFCSKHSTSQDVGSAQQTSNLSRSVADDFSVAKPQWESLLPNKLPKLRLSCKSKEKNIMQPEMGFTLSREVGKIEEDLEKDAFSLKLSPKGDSLQLIKNLNVGISDDDNSIPGISNLVSFIKKLIGEGKITVGNFALEMGVSSDSLEEVLKGECSSLPSEVRPKIAKWFHKSVFVPASMRQLKYKNGSAINAAAIQGLDIRTGAKDADPDNSAACSFHSKPLNRGTKNKIRVVKEDKAVLSRVKIRQSSNGEIVDVISEVPVVHAFGTKDDTGSTSPTHEQRPCYKDQFLIKVTTEDTAPHSNYSRVIAPQMEGTSATAENSEMPEMHHPECTVESVAATELGNDQIEESECSHDAVNRGSTCGGYSKFNVHPFIQKRLMPVEEEVPFKKETRESSVNDIDCSEGRILSTKTSDSHIHCLPPMPAEVDHLVGLRQLDQLAEAKQMGILELSPEDELEGEIIYLENKLIDNSVTLKRQFENLMGNVVQKLPIELELLKKQRWDMVFVDQFLHDVIEAKKQGRKERKQREAQAALAAAAAAAATSRNSLLRKDGADEISPPHQESPMKVPLDSGMQEMTTGNALYCDICRRSETLLKRISVCSSCKVAVHLECYRKLNVIIGPWKCEWCEEICQSGSVRNQSIECGLCGGGTGAFRKATNGKWVHAFCAEWLLQPTFRRGQQNLVDGMDHISKQKGMLKCCLCHQNFGVCSKCNYGNCQVSFHPYCARNAGFYMNVKTIGGRFQYKAYCEKHSVEQKLKAVNQQYGPEDLKSIKEIRFELERVRLLCERIIKREKVKRDVVLCSHEILAARRDFVAYETPVRSSSLTGGSSDSATTSIDNRSFSGTYQRSEEVTIDSTVSGKRTFRLSSDMDQKTDDSSTSQISFKRKIPDRTSCSGKQIPNRITSVRFRSSADEGEKRSKMRKQAEIFHKEVVMTTHQASMQNRRLPKGFVYVPVDYLSRGNPVLHDSEPREPEEPGG